MQVVETITFKWFTIPTSQERPWRICSERYEQGNMNDFMVQLNGRHVL